jgi:hypothetical protein
VLECVYKLAEYQGRPVRETSSGKVTWPGRKQVWRANDWSGDVVGLADEPGPPAHRPLLEPVMNWATHWVIAGAHRCLPPVNTRVSGGRRGTRTPDFFLVREAL